MRLLAAGLVLAAGCAGLLGPTVVRWSEAPPRKRADPVIARRDECLKPPFTLPPGKATNLHGLRIEPRGDGPRELTLLSLSGEPFDPDGLLDFQNRNLAALKAIDGVETVGLSGCPGAGKPVPCLALGLSLCTEPLEALADQLSQVITADKQALGHQLVFHVTLVGAVGPRCEADDAMCRPEPYESARYEPGDRRGLLSAPQGDPECAWDGECTKSGCGNSCEPWTTAHHVGTCESRPQLRDALCGCVEHRCAWFVQ